MHLAAKPFLAQYEKIKAPPPLSLFLTGQDGLLRKREEDTPAIDELANTISATVTIITNAPSDQLDPDRVRASQSLSMLALLGTDVQNYLPDPDVIRTAPAELD